MKVVRIDGDNGIVNSGGLKKTVNLSFLKNVKVGDHLLIHAGFAIERIKDSEAKKTLRALRNIGE
jgi:hydrogenase expression/formation protein HypC